MARWGIVCIILSGIVGLIREGTALKYKSNKTILYKILWSISLVLLILGAILYFYY